MNTQELTNKICEVLSSKKAYDITIINVEEMTILTDNYVICSAKSSTGVKALANYVDEELGKIGVEPLHRDGMRDGNWAVIDYGSVIVHVFLESVRETYNLEKIWDNGTNTTKYED